MVSLGNDQPLKPGHILQLPALFAWRLRSRQTSGRISGSEGGEEQDSLQAEQDQQHPKEQYSSLKKT
ncbi:hypothetical protein EYF80_034330 [Liparis tanakae]|uniref:Uncharacterized protein n=1 Tax=Liparis tanakae TaxID=230148 RepID=A0A4Z2GP65_9TELE|nr:hypothetical protein EYF80_034330 [Liparis tanakae]